MKIDMEINELRKVTKMLAPTADFDAKYTFYYDETNNIKKFHVKENDFNTVFSANFVLGGLVYEGIAPNVQPLIDSFRLQKTVKEVKFDHIAFGTFLDCLKSTNLKLYLKFILDSNLYVHYSSLNILYWSIVDIVDSAIANSDVALQLGIPFANKLKNDLYKLSKLEIDSVIELFYRFGYPNITEKNIIPFIENLVSIFDGYLDDTEFHFGLESLRQILKESKKKNSLPFIMDEENHILIKDLSDFYMRNIYLFKNSNHIFDNENDIVEKLDGYKLLDGEKELNNYSFIDSKTDHLIQLSDVFVGLFGKLTNYLNTRSINDIQNDFNRLTAIQEENMDLFIKVIDKSCNKNIGFLHDISSYEELNKFQIIRNRKIYAESNLPKYALPLFDANKRRAQ